MSRPRSHPRFNHVPFEIEAGACFGAGVHMLGVCEWVDVYLARTVSASDASCPAACLQPAVGARPTSAAGARKGCWRVTGGGTQWIILKVQRKCLISALWFDNKGTSEVSISVGESRSELIECAQ